MPANDPHLRTSAACCCPAKPAVIVVMPPGPGRSHPTELLLCGHHYRKSEQTLMEAGATVFNLAGAEVAVDDHWLVGAGANRPS